MADNQGQTDHALRSNINCYISTVRPTLICLVTIFTVHLLLALYLLLEMPADYLYTIGDMQWVLRDPWLNLELSRYCWSSAMLGRVTCFHPNELLAFIVGWVSPSWSLSQIVVLRAPFFLASLVMWWVLYTRLSISASISVIGGLLYGLNAFTLHTSTSTMLMFIYALAPAFMVHFYLIMRGSCKKTRNVAWLAVALSLGGIGNLQVVVICFLTCISFLFIPLFEASRSWYHRFQLLFKRSSHILVAVAIMLLLGCGQYFVYIMPIFCESDIPTGKPAGYHAKISPGAFRSIFPGASPFLTPFVFHNTPFGMTLFLLPLSILLVIGAIRRGFKERRLGICLLCTHSAVILFILISKWMLTNTVTFNPEFWMLGAMTSPFKWALVQSPAHVMLLSLGSKSLRDCIRWVPQRWEHILQGVGVRLRGPLFLTPFLLVCILVNLIPISKFTDRHYNPVDILAWGGTHSVAPNDVAHFYDFAGHVKCVGDCDNSLRTIYIPMETTPFFFMLLKCDSDNAIFPCNRYWATELITTLIDYQSSGGTAEDLALLRILGIDKVAVSHSIRHTNSLGIWYSPSPELIFGAPVLVESILRKEFSMQQQFSCHGVRSAIYDLSVEHAPVTARVFASNHMHLLAGSPESIIRAGSECLEWLPFRVRSVYRDVTSLASDGPYVVLINKEAL